MISDSTNCAVLLATAKQMPCAPEMIAVLMPITSDDDDTSGPPELPGLSAASVWITSSMVRPLTERIERPSADTTPAVTVDSNPSGLPIATTSCPRRRLFELPSEASGESRLAAADDGPSSGASEVKSNMAKFLRVSDGYGSAAMQGTQH